MASSSGTRRGNPVRISAVLPVFNEQENIPEVYRRTTATLANITSEHEILFVNDGSTDGTFPMLEQLAATDPRVRVIDFSRNFGHQVAISAGMYYAAGDVVALLDADLQDPPEELGRFIDAWREGYDVVYAVRRNRKEGVLKRMSYFVFYRLWKTTASVPVSLDSGDFCVLDRRVVDVFNALPERARFLRGLRSWIGFSSIGLEYDRAVRSAGSSKYSWFGLIRLAFDGLVSFSRLPLQLMSIVGVAVATLSAVGLILAFIETLGNFTFFGREPATGFTKIVMSILFLSGVQLIFLGVIGEYIGRIFEEVKQRPLFVVRRFIGFAETEHTSLLPQFPKPAESPSREKYSASPFSLPRSR
jgi:dolichol-phosphate mannosyltransferase